MYVDSAGGLDGGEGVVDEVAEHAFERFGVSAHGDVVVGAERDGRAGRAYVGVFDEWAHDGGEVDGCSGGVCFEPGEPEEVVDEAAESFALAGDGCFEPVAYALVADVVTDDQRVAAFGIQRMRSRVPI